MKELPSAPGPHIEKIKALADDSWLEVGQPAADPKWGQGRGRSWCPHMQFAPELGGAFLIGEGVHAFVKPDGHYMDDFYFYDLNAHAWICLYPGTKAGKDQGFKLTDAGFFANEAGDIFPPGLLAHEYDQAAYDTEQRKFAFIPKGGATGWWITMKCEQVKELAPEANARMKGKGYSPWYYNTRTGKFERELLAGQGPTSTTGGGAFVYIQDGRKFFLRGTGNWLYETDTKSWSKAAADPSSRPVGGDTVSCYDSKRGRVYLAGGGQPGADGLFAYDPKADKWLDLKPIPKAQRCTGNSAHLTYDSANDVLVLALAGRGLLIYDPAADAWLNEEPKPAAGLGSAFYDSRNSVHYYFSARDSREGGKFYAYRYKRAK